MLRNLIWLVRSLLPILCEPSKWEKEEKRKEERKFVVNGKVRQEARHPICRCGKKFWWLVFSWVSSQCGKCVLWRERILKEEWRRGRECKTAKGAKMGF